MTTAARLAAAVRPVDADVAVAARERVDALTKPPGSLGRLEDLAVRVSAIAGEIPRRGFGRKVVVIGAGDHGVTAEGVSPYPAEVTQQMVAGFLAGHAAISAVARAAGADVVVVDFGMAAPAAPHLDLIDQRVGAGTRNLGAGDAMDAREVDAALLAGERALESLVARGPYDLIALGEMGIGNTTTAAAIVGALTGRSAAEVVGRGTGADDAMLARKREVVARVLEELGPEPSWEAVARRAGGFEILGLVGVTLAAAARRIPVVLDGFIVGAVALLAARIAPAVTPYLIASHRSIEPGHAVALEALGLEPLLDFGMRLGEGSGAALALPIVEAATRVIAEMLTFEEAGVSDRE